jgi:hypothetical protein
LTSFEFGDTCIDLELVSEARGDGWQELRF